MKLYVLISDSGDGSYCANFVLDESVLAALKKADDDQDTDQYSIGVDADGFHYKTITVPDGSTAESLGISVITHEDLGE